MLYIFYRHQRKIEFSGENWESLLTGICFMLPLLPPPSQKSKLKSWRKLYSFPMQRSLVLFVVKWQVTNWHLKSFLLVNVFCMSVYSFISHCIAHWNPLPLREKHVWLVVCVACVNSQARIHWTIIYNFPFGDYYKPFSPFLCVGGCLCAALCDEEDDLPNNRLSFLLFDILKFSLTPLAQ